MSAALGLAVALAAWTLSGWSPSDAAWLRARADDIARRLLAAVLALRPPARARAKGAEASLAEVSEMIDVVRLGLSAGLSFDAALDLYCQSRGNALARRLAEAIASWQTGIAGREEALGEVADELGVRVLESFASTVGQALALGAPLSEALAGMSREIRAAHRSEVEREIERAPVKLLVPTGTLILPALLLSILGPLLAAGGMM